MWCALSLAGGGWRACGIVQDWIGYERAYEGQRGAMLGKHGEEASSLRQYETNLEVRHAPPCALHLPALRTVMPCWRARQA